MSIMAVEENSAPAPVANAPWLVFTHGEGGKDQTFFNLFESSSNDNNNNNHNNNNNIIHRKSIPEMGFNNSLTYYQSPSHQGWLIIHCDCEEEEEEISTSTSPPSSKWKLGDCFLWNPVTLETIQLPNLQPWLHNYHITHSVLSSPPTTSNQSMVFFLFERAEVSSSSLPSYFLLFCRPALDKQWSKHDLSSTLSKGSIQSLIFFKGKLHVPCYNNIHLEIEPQLGYESNVPTTLSVSVKSLEVTSESLSTVVGSYVPFRPEHVESCNEIFKVVQIYHPKTVDEQVYRLEVFRLNFCLMAWEKVKTLGDHVLFIGGNKTKACSSAADLGLPRGFVYFTLPKDKSLYQFDLEGQSISVSLPCPDLPAPWLCSGWLAMPTTPTTTTTVRDSDGRRRGIDDISTSPLVKKTSSIDVITTTASQSHPWLLFPTKEDDDETIYDLVDPNRNNEEKYHMNSSDEYLSGAVIRFSKGGWLLMSRGERTVFFFNPFTRQMVKLPDLPDEWSFMFPCISFSSSPTSSDCSVFAITIGGTESSLIFSIKRGDNSWSCGLFNNTRLPSSDKCMEFMAWFNSPVFCNGAFYCLDYDGTLGVFDVKNGLSWKVLSKPDRPCDSAYQKFLVECDGELLSVFIGHLGKWVQIFRLDFSNMEWVKIESLGKHALFISHTSCFSAVAPDSSMENKIYFPRLHGDGTLFYSLDTGRYHSLGSTHSALDFYNTKEKLECTWIEPNWSQNTDEELDWLISV